MSPNGMKTILLGEDEQRQRRVIPAVEHPSGTSLNDAQPVSPAFQPWFTPEKLTEREAEVLKLIAEGLSTKKIATTLGIAFKTAASHRANLLEKFGIHKTVSLVRCAIRMGIIEP